MSMMRDPDTKMAAWLDDGPDALPNETRQAIVVGIRTTSRRRRGILSALDLRLLSVAAGAAVLVIVVAGAVGLNFIGNQQGIGAASPSPTPPPTPDPRASFLGSWVSTSDYDGGTQTMTVEVVDDNTVGIVVTDTIASVCDRTPSTMIGDGVIDGNTLVIAEPDYTCDDGSEPALTNGDPTPLNEVLRDLTYVRDAERDTLTATDEGVWYRPGEAPTPAPTTDPRSAFVGTWISTTDGDDGIQTMNVELAGDDKVEIVVTDTIASVCDGTPSTMTGDGSIDGDRLVIAEPDYTCDDGSDPALTNGDPTPLNEVLRNLTYVRDPERDSLSVGDGDVWLRAGAPDPFLGTWISTSDADGGTQTMTVEPSGEFGVEIVVTDTVALVCDRTPSTMTGTGAVVGDSLVIPTPDYTCDDGSEPALINGDPTPLNEVLRNLTHVYDPESDTLTVGDAVWTRSQD